MYQLVSAVGKLKTSGARWHVVDIAGESMADIYNRYAGVKAVVSNNFITGVQTLDLQEIKGPYFTSALTLDEVFAELGNAALPTTPGVPDVQTKYAIYSDAFRANYKVEPADTNGSTHPNILPADKPWLALTKPGIDYQLFHKSCLVSINGMFHLTDTNGQAAFVVDGMKSCRHSGRNEIGLYSFRELGALQFLPITADMIHRRHENLPLTKRLYLDIGTPRPNQVAALVLGGYLHILDSGSFKQVASTIYCVDVEQLPLRERYYESKNLIDLSSLQLETRDENPDQVVVQELYSDENLIRYATLSQSFLVFIDNKELFLEKQAVRTPSVPHSYVSFQAPRYPLVVGTGRVADYWRVYEDKQWSVKVVDSMRKNHTFATTLTDNVVTMDDSVLPYNAQDMSHAHYLVVGTDLRINLGE